MKRSLFGSCLLAIFFLFVLHSKAQNLVLNPSFELHNPCPLRGDLIKDCKSWTLGDEESDTIDSPVYLNNCEHYQGPNGSYGYYYGIPNNTHGYQYPRTGNAMIMLYNLFYVGPSQKNPIWHYRQWINGTLSRQLAKGQKYHAGCYVNLPNGSWDSSSQFFNDNFGLYFSDSIHTDTTEPTIFRYRPQVQNPRGRLLGDTQNWMLVDGIFTANGSEKYIYLGSFNDDRHTTFNTTAYIYRQPNSAELYVDDVFVAPVNFPSVNPAKDTVLCQGQKLTLHSMAGDSFHAQWQNGSRGDSFVVTEQGTYWVQYDSLGDTVRDSIHVGYIDFPAPMPQSLFVCTFPYTLQVPVDSNYTYYWPDGSTGFQYSAPKPGLTYYHIRHGKCIEKDSIRISSKDQGKPVLPADTSFCDNDTLTIDISGLGNNIAWQDSSTNKIYPITRAGNYKLFIKTGCGDIENDMKVFEGQCHCDIRAPNAFSPDSNGINDVFKCINACPLQRFDIEIFNRLGVKVFQTDDITKGWNGNYKSLPCANGIYVYYIQYQFTGQSPQTKLGNLEILR